MSTQPYAVRGIGYTIQTSMYTRCCAYRRLEPSMFRIVRRPALLLEHTCGMPRIRTQLRQITYSLNQ
jgi:hypothetical protein